LSRPEHIYVGLDKNGQERVKTLRRSPDIGFSGLWFQRYGFGRLVRSSGFGTVGFRTLDIGLRASDTGSGFRFWTGYGYWIGYGFERLSDTGLYHGVPFGHCKDASAAVAHRIFGCNVFASYRLIKSPLRGTT